MTDRQYHARIEAAFRWAEQQAETLSQSGPGDLDIEAIRQGGSVLNLEFPPKQVMIINAQAPLEQLWLASRLGAQHFVFSGDAAEAPTGVQGWSDTRSGESFDAAFQRHVAALLPKG